jgi:hypothetical protein
MNTETWVGQPRTAKEAAAWAARWRDLEELIRSDDSFCEADPVRPEHVAAVGMMALIVAVRDSLPFALALRSADREADEILADLVASFGRVMDCELARVTGRGFGVPRRPSRAWQPFGLGVFARPRWTEAPAPVGDA